MVNLLAAVVIGALQGVLEWLPVSSQGNLMLVLVGFFGLTVEEALNYSIWVHAGTLLSAAVYFRKDIAALWENRMELSFLLKATLASALVGAPLYFFFRGFPVQQGTVVLALIGLLLVVTGMVQLKARAGAGKKPDTRSAVVTGVAQGFSALPGISRSGTATSALLLQGFSGGEALRLSFLLSIPLVLGAELFLGVFEPAVINLASVVSAAAAFVVGLASIDLFLRIAGRVRFGWLCIGLGVLAVLPALLF
jgi:undecaprenyl-diphosphatase